MTRINSVIDPKNLTDQHLIAELRELPRIFTAVNKRIEKGKSFDDIPEKFTLGTGHTKFFYNKLYFLNFRFQDLKMEYKNRYNKKWQFDKLAINDHTKVADTFLFNGYQPTSEEKQLLIDRISTRITESNHTPRYYGEKITKEQAINLLIFGTLSLIVTPPIKGSHNNFTMTNEGDRINSVLNNEYLRS